MRPAIFSQIWGQQKMSHRPSDRPTIRQKRHIEAPSRSLYNYILSLPDFVCNEVQIFQHELNYFFLGTKCGNFEMSWPRLFETKKFEGCRDRDWAKVVKTKTLSRVSLITALSLIIPSSSLQWIKLRYTGNSSNIYVKMGGGIWWSNSLKQGMAKLTMSPTVSLSAGWWWT